MFNKKLIILNILLLALILYFTSTANTHAATWSAVSPIPSDTNFLLEDFKYDYNPATNTITMTYTYKNITGSTIPNPRVVNLFTWSNDICSIPWVTMPYDGSGGFSNAGQSATAIDPVGLFDWNGLILSPLDSSGLFPALPTQTTQEGVSYPYWFICNSQANQWADQESATFSTSWSVLNPYWVQSLNWIASCEGIDCPTLPDSDTDGFADCQDNCLLESNPGQEDSYPWPSGNVCGDACECEANFDGDDPDDVDVDGTDLATFKANYGRNQYNAPCSLSTPCDGNFNCDNNVDGNDLAIFKADYGRNQYNRPCPPCSTKPWCSTYQ